MILPRPPLLYDDLHKVGELLSRQWLDLDDRAGDSSASHLEADHVADRRWTPNFDGLTQLGAVFCHDNASIHARGLSHGDLDTFPVGAHGEKLQCGQIDDFNVGGMRRLMRNAAEASILVLSMACLSVSASHAASISEAHNNQNGDPLPGILVEADIEPGDALRLQGAVYQFDVVYSPHVARFIYLRSKGGDVEEAMKMGTFIRRMRLETEAPTQIQGHSDIFSWVSPAEESNNICASACFLVCAGGVQQHGNLLALHRPYLPKDTASKLSDLDYETAERRVMAKVRQYLQDMEVNHFFIDKLMSNSSQDAYHVALWETDEYHLSQVVPSLEEAVLSRCPSVTKEEAHRVDSGAAGPEERKRIFAKLKAAADCKDRALDDMRLAAFKREMENLTQKYMRRAP